MGSMSSQALFFICNNGSQANKNKKKEQFIQIAVSRMAYTAYNNNYHMKNHMKHVLFYRQTLHATYLIEIIF